MSPLSRLLPLAAVLVALAVPATAAAETVVADPNARELTALGGTIVWVSQASANSQVLMQRTSDGTVARVQGAPAARFYRSPDLGFSSRGRLVLTYLRCTGVARCVARRDDLAGNRSSFPGYAPRGCELTTAPALSGSRAAYGLECRRGGKADLTRSGLYVKAAGQSPRQRTLPADARRFGVRFITHVDLRGTRVGAIAADIYEYAFTLTYLNKPRGDFLAAASEGESNEDARGAVLDDDAALWTLVDSEHVGDPNQAIIHRLFNDCLSSERLPNPAGPNQETGFRATDIAVDARIVYLIQPGTGIVTHTFTPERDCIPQG